jgi:hypothetical protein
MAIKVSFENEHHHGRGKRASRVLAELDGLEERLNKRSLAIIKTDQLANNIKKI